MIEEERDLKAVLERYFTATVDEQYLMQYPEINKPIGAPLFYDSNGELLTKHISQKTGMSEGGVMASFESWRANGNTPPTERRSRSTEEFSDSDFRESRSPSIEYSQMTYEAPARADDSNYLREAKETMSDMVELRRLEQQLEEPVRMAPTSGMDQTASIIAALAPILGKNESKGIDAQTMMLMKQLNDRTNDSTAQLVALFNMNQQTQQSMTALLVEAMRGGGNRSSLEERILNSSVDRMLTGGDSNTPESSIWADLIQSGELGNIANGIAQGVAGIAGARRPPTQSAANYDNPALEAPVQEDMVPPIPQYEISQEQEVAYQPTFQEKCTVLMEQIYAELTDEWRADGAYMQILGNAIEISVGRAETFIPDNADAQIAFAMREIMVFTNMRLLAQSIHRIETGEGGVTVEMAASVLQGHPMWPTFANETGDSLISLVSAYHPADTGEIPSVAHDIEYLTSERAQPIIHQLLALAKGGA